MLFWGGEDSLVSLGKRETVKNGSEMHPLPWRGPWAPAPSSALHQAIGTTFKALENLQGKDVPGLGGPQESEVTLCSLILSFSLPSSGAWVF